MSTKVDAFFHLFGGTIRGWRGTQAYAPAQKRPEKWLKLYDIEACPSCRLVREVLTELDIDVMILPCPVEGRRFRPEAERVGGKKKFPMLVDENTGDVLYDSSEIIAHLFRTYAPGRDRPSAWTRPVAVATSYLASAMFVRLAGVGGLHAIAAKSPVEPLELFSFESSPYSKPVRARLCELEIPYVLHNTGKGRWTDMGPPSFRDGLWKSPKGTGRNRRWLEEHTGKVQVPYLIDSNTGTAMYESQKIIQYLDETYRM